VWRFSALLCLIQLLVTAVAEESANSKTVIGPRNINLYNGAERLRAKDGVEGVRLTLRGLQEATSFHERKIAHSNLCAGFILVEQLRTALEHCNWVLERDDRHWRTYNNRALVYLRLERFDESNEDIRKGQALNPSSTNLKEVKGMYLDKVEPVTERITIDERRNAHAPEIPVEPPQK
jgi:tetratricopeptide (TPR) repeat protein